MAARKEPRTTSSSATSAAERALALAIASRVPIAVGHVVLPLYSVSVSELPLSCGEMVGVGAYYLLWICACGVAFMSAEPRKKTRRRTTRRLGADVMNPAHRMIAPNDTELRYIDSVGMDHHSPNYDCQIQVNLRTMTPAHDFLTKAFEKLRSICFVAGRHKNEKDTRTTPAAGGRKNSLCGKVLYVALIFACLVTSVQGQGAAQIGGRPPQSVVMSVCTISDVFGNL